MSSWFLFPKLNNRRNKLQMIQTRRCERLDGNIKTALVCLDKAELIGFWLISSSAMVDDVHDCWRWTLNTHTRRIPTCWYDFAEFVFRILIEIPQILFKFRQIFSVPFVDKWVHEIKMVPKKNLIFKNMGGEMKLNK